MYCGSIPAAIWIKQSRHTKRLSNRLLGDRSVSIHKGLEMAMCEVWLGLPFGRDLSLTSCKINDVTQINSEWCSISIQSEVIANC